LKDSNLKDDDYEAFHEFTPGSEDADKDEYADTATLLGGGKSLALGIPGSEKRFWFQRSKTVYDLDQPENCVECLCDVENTL
jgi:hypothetical protein